MIAKFLANAVMGIVFGVFAGLTALATGAIAISIRGYDLGLDDSRVWSGRAGPLAIALWSMIGVGVGTLIRNQIAAIIGLILIVFLVERLLSFGLMAIDLDPSRGLPSMASSAMVSASTPITSLLAWWQGALVMLGYAGLFTGLGAALRTPRRELSQELAAPAVDLDRGQVVAASRTPVDDGDGRAGPCGSLGEAQPAHHGQRRAGHQEHPGAIGERVDGGVATRDAVRRDVSPKKTRSGFSTPPQVSQPGTTKSVVCSSSTSPSGRIAASGWRSAYPGLSSARRCCSAARVDVRRQPMQITSAIRPCRATRSRWPASSCRPSTFWVIAGPARENRERPVAGVGLRARIRPQPRWLEPSTAASTSVPT